MSLLKPYYHFNKHIEAGVDEAGCGCLAGPVFAAAVILPLDFNDGRIRDSKKLSEKARTILAGVVKELSLAYAVEMIPPDEIDKINILNARNKAMHMALDRKTFFFDRFSTGNYTRPVTLDPEVVSFDGCRCGAYLVVATEGFRLSLAGNNWNASAADVRLGALIGALRAILSDSWPSIS